MTLCWLEWGLCDVSDVSPPRLTHYSDQPGYPDTGTRWPDRRHCVRHTGRHNWRNFLADHVLTRPDLRQWNDQTNVKHIVFIWMFVGETHLFLVQAHYELPGQASNIVTFISQPPSNQMSLFPTYLITVLIYGIISYQTQNLPQLKLWHSGPLHLAYEGFVFWVTFYFLTAPARPLSPCHTANCGAKTNILSLIHQWWEITSLYNQEILKNEWNKVIYSCEPVSMNSKIWVSKFRSACGYIYKHKNIIKFQETKSRNFTAGV